LISFSHGSLVVAALADAPPLDVLHVPGGYGQEALMEDAEILAWIRQRAAGACYIFSVCTGALICGAAGLLKGRPATIGHVDAAVGPTTSSFCWLNSPSALPALAATPRLSSFSPFGLNLWN
jgi:hypothetical protein